MRRLAILPVLGLAMLALSACEPEDAPTESDNAFATQDRFAAAEAACFADGGRWGRGGLAQQFVCYKPTRDANQFCSSGSDCETLCLSRSRTCAPEAPLFGCHEVLTDSGFPATVCID